MLLYTLIHLRTNLVRSPLFFLSQHTHFVICVSMGQSLEVTSFLFRISTIFFRFVTVLEYCDGNDLDFLLKQQKMIPEKEVGLPQLNAIPVSISAHLSFLRFNLIFNSHFTFFICHFIFSSVADPFDHGHGSISRASLSSAKL